MAEQDKTNLPAQASGRFIDPFSAFRGEMDRLVDAFFGSRSALPTPDLRVGGIALVPEVDVTEDDKAVTVTAELPGLSDKDVEVSLHDGVLTLKGEKREEKTDADARVTERRYGRFQRSFRLPDGVEEAGVSASFDNGVLKIVAPKNPNAAPKARSIPIGGKAA